MLRYALIFLLISIVAGLFGFTNISSAAAGISKILFFIALIILVIILVLAVAGGNMVF
jgi:uncharacterized membrane protein YtjA (UPF0391 family)